MPKFKVGDITVVTDRRGPMVVEVIGWRGGGVAPYQVRIIEGGSGIYAPGTISYFSGRDMELKEMQGKKKVYCDRMGCRTYCFLDAGVVTWECRQHYTGNIEPCVTLELSLEEKVDFILTYSKLWLLNQRKIGKEQAKQQDD